MKDEKKTKDELITESIELRQRITDLRASEIQRKQTEEALHREKYWILVKESPLGVSIIGRNGHYRYINPKFVEIFGYTLEDIPTGREWFAKAYPDQEYRNQVISTWINDLKESKCGESRPRTFIVTCKDGSERIIYFRPVTMETGEHFVIYEDITQRKRAEEELEHSRSHFQTLFQVMVDPVAIVDGKGEFLEVTNGVEEITGFKREELLRKNFLRTSMVTAKSKAILMKNLAKRMLGMKFAPYEVEVLTKDGKKIPYEVNAAKIKYMGKPAVMAVFRDLTERKRMEEALIQERNLLQALIDNIPDAIYFKDDKNRFIRVNKAKAELSGTTPESMVGKTDFDYFPKEQATQALADDNRVMKSNRPLVCKVEKVTHADGTEHWVSVTKMPRHNKKGKVIGTMGLSRDVTTDKQQQEQLANMATHDTLTGLANRVLFSDHLTLALAGAQRNSQKFPIMLLDLDNFKDVNDRLGHSGGDKLLQAAGGRLNGILRKADAVARMGGDEFLLLLAETTKTEDIDLVAQKILAAFQRPFLLDDHQIRTTASIGIAIYPSDGKDADSLIKNADIAMYYAKEKGRNNYQYYAAAVDTQDIANS